MNGDWGADLMLGALVEEVFAPAVVAAA